jgi:hypothetical protein
LTKILQPSSKSSFYHLREEPRGTQRGREAVMRRIRELLRDTEGKIGYILLWALGVPVPILLVIFLLRGCN